MRRNLRKLKHIHIIPLTGTKLLPMTAGVGAECLGLAPRAHRAKTIQIQVWRCISFLQFDSQGPEERLE